MKSLERITDTQGSRGGPLLRDGDGDDGGHGSVRMLMSLAGYRDDTGSGSRWQETRIPDGEQEDNLRLFLPYANEIQRAMTGLSNQDRTRGKIAGPSLRHGQGMKQGGRG